MKRLSRIAAVLLACALAAAAGFLVWCHPAKARNAYGWERCFCPTLKARVIDAASGAPVEGAAVFCLWRVTKGMPGLTYDEVYKIVDTATDKDGWFTVPGTWNPLVNPPDLSVYKKGYVLWNVRDVFPSKKRRNDFTWKTGATLRLEPWKEEYSREEHQWFADSHPQYSDLRLRFFNSLWKDHLDEKERNKTSGR